MKNSQVIEGNRLIAEFMGMNKDADDVWSDKATGKIVILGEYRPHTDWNELIPVAQKIKSFQVQEQLTVKSQLDLENTAMVLWEAVCYAAGCLNIEMMWQAVIQFIQWYNSQTSKPHHHE